MGTHHYAESMDTDIREETDDAQHRRLLRALRARLGALRSAEAAGAPPPPLAPEEEADEATREVLYCPETIIGLIEGIEDVMAGDVVTFEEFRAERRRTPPGDGEERG
jgi:hypothetical protein